MIGRGSGHRPRKVERSLIRKLEDAIRERNRRPSVGEAHGLIAEAYYRGWRDMQELSGVSGPLDVDALADDFASDLLVRRGFLKEASG